MEAGLVPGTGEVRRPTAAFTHNGPVPHFICKPVHVKLNVAPNRSPITAQLPPEAVIPAWAAHGQGRLAASPEHLGELQRGHHVAFVYCNADGSVTPGATPNDSALFAAALVNREGNVLAIMPHPERDGWNLNHPDRRTSDDVNEPSGGAIFFRSFVHAVNA